MILLYLGTNLKRAQKALELMGGAVLNGGTTTFLAVILLSDSTSYALITFFKVFFLTVLFGLFHAMVFLPVVLCIEIPLPSFCFIKKNLRYCEKCTEKRKNPEERKEIFPI